MSRPATRLPEELRKARTAYLDLKVSYGLCREMQCGRHAEPEHRRCRTCMDRHTRAQLRYQRRQAQATRERTS